MKRIPLLLALVLLGIAAKAQLSSGLVAYYPFDGTFGDSSGNGHTVTPVNGVDFGTDHFGNPGMAAHFNGVDQWAYTPVTPDLTLSDVFTVAMWYKPGALFDTTTDDNDQSLLTFCDTPDASAISCNQIQYKLMYGAMHWTGSNNISFETHHQGTCIVNDMQDILLSGNPLDSTLTAEPMDTVWRFLVAVFDHGLKKVYENGVLTGMDSVSSSMINPYQIDGCGGGLMKFGTWWWSDPEFLNGMIDEVMIYDHVLTDDEIDTLYNKQSNPTAVLTVGQSNLRFVMSPNPVSDLLNIHVAGAQSGLVNCTVTTATGNVIRQMSFNGPSENIPMSEVPAGLYFLTLETDKGKVTTRFVKQ